MLNNANGTVKADQLHIEQTNRISLLEAMFTLVSSLLMRLQLGKEGGCDTLHRFVQPRSSLTIGRDRKKLLLNLIKKI